MAVTATNTSGNGSASPEVETEAAGEMAVEAPALASAAGAPAVAEDRWPGWPGNSVFRMIVPVVKVGSIIGRKGELIKKLCEDTKARVRILDGAVGTTDRIVLVSGKEEPDAEISPAMDAVLRIFKRINSLSETGADATTPASTAPAVCSVRLLVPSYQAINLIGKQGTTIKSIQDNCGATVRVLTGAADERVVDIQGEPLKVLKALEAVVGHLRKFLVDHSVLPLYEKSLNTPPVSQDRPADPWGQDKTQTLMHTAQQTAIGNDYPLSLKRDSSYLDPEPHLDSHIHRSGLSLYGQDPALSGLRTSALGRTPSAFVTQVTQTMQIPLSYAEDIIGVGGGNIAYIRRSSGAVITVMETRGAPDEITVELKGTSTQVHSAQQLIMDCVEGRKEPPAGSGYGSLDTGLSQVDPIVASFSGGAVGVISALMVVEINNVRQQEQKRCKYCVGTGYLACARCSTTGYLVLVEPIATMNGGDQPLPPPRTERCSNCSGSGKVMCPTCLCTGMAMASEHDPRIDPFD